MTAGEIGPGLPARNPRYTAAWFLRRLILGTFILVVSLGGLAWLTHAAIDQDQKQGETLLEVIGRLTTNL